MNNTGGERCNESARAGQSQKAEAQCAKVMHKRLHGKEWPQSICVLQTQHRTVENRHEAWRSASIADDEANIRSMNASAK